MSAKSDARYFEKRAATHCDLAAQATNREARVVYRELGERYAARAAALLDSADTIAASYSQTVAARGAPIDVDQSGGLLTASISEAISAQG